MKTIMLRAGIAMLALSAASANAAGLLDNYTVEFVKQIATPEASGIAYDWDSQRLLVVNDEEEHDGSGAILFNEYDLDGNKVSNIRVSGCLSLGSAQCDPEGATYAGNGKYVIAEERYQDIALITKTGTVGSEDIYTALDGAPTVSIGGNAGNSGLEGIAYNRITGDYYGVKETSSQTVWKVSGVDFDTETAASITTLFDPSTLGLDRLSDIAVLSNGMLAASPFGDNLLILSGRSFKIVEVTQAGNIVSTYDLSGLKSLIDLNGEAAKFEGLTLDALGNIYLVSDDGDAEELQKSFMVKLTYTGPHYGAVPEPATWAMMIAGFGLVGAAARRTARRTAIA